MTIALPDKPDGGQYEDYVIACLQALGYFVESQLILREGKMEVLELDVVGTPQGMSSTDRILFEAKKTKFSFSDIFKLFGQKTYLGIQHAAIVSMLGAEEQYASAFESIGNGVGVSCCHLPVDCEDCASLAPATNNLNPEERRKIVVSTWYGQIARRLALGNLNRQITQNRDAELFESVKRYLKYVRTGFFLSDPLKRAESLYGAYLEYPKKTGKAVSFCGQQESIQEDDVWKSIQETSERAWIQSIMDLEASGRLMILKNALEDFLSRGDQPLPSRIIKVGSIPIEFPDHELPPSFQSGLEALKDHRDSRHLPYLFQSFYNIFGGFIFFKNEREMDLLSRLSGIEKNSIIDSLHLLDKFFAGDGKSCFYTGKGELFQMKMVPAFVRGTGAFLRQTAFGVSHYDLVYPQMGWLLVKWHNALYHLLKPYLRRVS